MNLVRLNILPPFPLSPLSLPPSLLQVGSIGLSAFSPTPGDICRPSTSSRRSATRACASVPPPLMSSWRSWRPYPSGGRLSRYVNKSSLPPSLPPSLPFQGLSLEKSLSYRADTGIHVYMYIYRCVFRLLVPSSFPPSPPPAHPSRPPSLLPSLRSVP